MVLLLTPARWTEVGDGCFSRRYDPYDVTITVVTGSEIALVVDTRADLAQGRQLRADVAALTDLPVRYVVNTHVHGDHTFGNVAFDDANIVAHESLVSTLPAEHDRARRDGVPLRLPDTTFASAWATDLGGRLVEVVHPGPAHTAGDAVVVVPSAGVVIAGDLVEQSGPPACGEDSYPLQWPDALDLLAALVPRGGVVVPGHGDAVDVEFVRDQRLEILGVAEQVNLLAKSSVGVDDAYAAGSWPSWPQPAVRSAIARAYAHWVP